MTKFEEKAQQEVEQANNTYEVYQGCFKSEVPDGGLVVRFGDQILRFPWLEFAKNWHSDEEYQELFDKYSNLNDNYEKEVIKSSKLESQIIVLKSQLQQQALPVVPEFVAEWIEILKTKGLKPLKNPETYGETGFTEETLQNIVFWISEYQEDYMRAWLDGYTVEKPQLFYLKHIDFCKTDKHYDWFTIKHSDGPLNHLRVEKGQKPSTIDCKFTQQEIDSMQTGSYEQIEVEK